jgi:hypothetical protein
LVNEITEKHRRYDIKSRRVVPDGPERDRRPSSSEEELGFAVAAELLRWHHFDLRLATC